MWGEKQEEHRNGQKDPRRSCIRNHERCERARHCGQNAQAEHPPVSSRISFVPKRCDVSTDQSCRQTGADESCSKKPVSFGEFESMDTVQKSLPPKCKRAQSKRLRNVAQNDQHISRYFKEFEVALDTTDGRHFLGCFFVFG